MQIYRDIYATGVKGVARMRQGDIRYEYVNYFNFYARKKRQTNFVSYEAGSRFVGDFSPISL